jgi:hypothetical protein
VAITNDLLECSRLYEHSQRDLQACRGIVRRSQGQRGAQATDWDAILRLPQETRRRRILTAVGWCGGGTMVGFVVGLVTGLMISR